MTDSFFLTKTAVDPRRMIAPGGVPALEQHDVLREFLAARAGREAAELFAEPVLSRGNGAAGATVSWYAARPGEGRRLEDMSSDTRAGAEASLKRTLARLSDGLSDPDLGPLLGAALHLDSPGDVWVVDGKPCLVNWGMVPPEAQESPAARNRHYAAGLGRFLPLAAAPAVTREEWESRGYARRSDPARAAGGAAAGVAAGSAMAAGEARAAESAGAAAPPETAAAGSAGGGGFGGGRIPPAPRDEGNGWRWRWIAPVGLLTLFALLLIWLLLPGSLLYPPTPRAATFGDEDLAEAARASNEALEQRIAALRSAVEGAVCTPEGELLLPGGRTPDGLAPAEGGGAGRPPGGPADGRADALVPPTPSRLVVPPAEGGGDPVSLLARLEASTALVLAVGEEAGGHGSGFFIAPDLVVTNHHVVAPAMGGGRILVTNERLGRLTPAELIAHSGPLQQTGGDFALLRVPGADMPAYEIARPGGSLRLQQVIAAGYPGFLMETDEAFQAMLEGDAASIPSLVVTDGIVNAEQRFSPQTQVMVHTAHISPGNSGGPLSDACGRVVGVNTFIRTDEASFTSLNFSLTSEDLLRFLDEAGVEATVTAAPCTPSVAQAPAPPAPSDEAGGSDAPPAPDAGAGGTTE